jgi:hypothetical protein
MDHPTPDLPYVMKKLPPLQRNIPDVPKNSDKMKWTNQHFFDCLALALSIP